MDSSVLSKYLNQEKSLGRKGMNTKYPSEFEVYMIALELVDGDGNNIEYFSFPVMPTQISKTEPTRTNIKKSASGVTVLSSDSFTPQEITIKGDFGRGFKIVMNPKIQEMHGVAFKGAMSNNDSKTSVFDPSIKTGFGATKILQSIISQSNKLDGRGKPCRLYLYNMALSESYLVAVPQSGLVLSQNYQKNMIWEYSLSLSILSPLDKIKPALLITSPKAILLPSNLENLIKETSTKSNWFIKNSAKALEFMKDTSKFDVSKYLTDFVNFVNRDFQNIVDYYKLGVDIADTSFNTFDFLWRQAQEVDSMVDNYRNVFVNCEIWELVDHFSDIQNRLETVKNMGRWSRSSRLGRSSNTIKVDYVQKQLEPFEHISKNTGSISPDDDWVSIAIENDVIEEDYSSTGGVMLSISFKNNTAFGIKNIVDNLIGDNVYGKDILKKFTIVDGDFSVLTGWDSLMQTFGTILSTMKGGIPEFPEDGTSSDVIGSNMNIISFPSIFRNLMEMFKKDDRFTSVNLVDVFSDEDKIFMKIEARTKIGKNVISNILL